MKEINKLEAHWSTKVAREMRKKYPAMKIRLASQSVRFLVLRQKLVFNLGLL